MTLDAATPSVITLEEVLGNVRFNNSVFVRTSLSIKLPSEMAMAIVPKAKI